MKSTTKNLSRLLAIFLLLALVLGMAQQGVFAAENEPSDASQVLAEATEAPTEPLVPTQTLVLPMLTTTLTAETTKTNVQVVDQYRS